MPDVLKKALSSPSAELRSIAVDGMSLQTAAPHPRSAFWSDSSSSSIWASVGSCSVSAICWRIVWRNRARRRETVWRTVVLVRPVRALSSS